MLSAYDQQGTLIVAWEAEREHGPFSCPECKRQVVAKKGQFIIHHFAHRPGSNCSYGTGESWEHWRAMFEMYNALRNHPLVSALYVELPLGSVRPDISFCWDGRIQVAIELQRSSLPPAEVARRTAIYDEKGIAVLWVSLPRDRFWAGARCSTRLWERFLHELYESKIFCWHGGEELLATRLDPFVLRRVYRGWFDKRSGTWREKEIQHLSKRLRMPSYYGAVHITDMKIVEVLPQQRGQFILPKAKLWSL